MFWIFILIVSKVLVIYLIYNGNPFSTAIPVQSTTWSRKLAFRTPSFCTSKSLLFYTPYRRRTYSWLTSLLICCFLKWINTLPVLSDFLQCLENNLFQTFVKVFSSLIFSFQNMVEAFCVVFFFFMGHFQGSPWKVQGKIIGLCFAILIIWS